MRRRPVAFIDSGVGGLPYCAAFRSLAPAESILYVADTANFPYGPKSKDELAALLVALVSRLRETEDPKLVVLACNTATISSIDALRLAFPGLPFVGTVPAVKPAVLASGRKRIGVIATRRTVEEPYIRDLAERCAPGCEVLGTAAPELVDFVEYRYAAASEEERLAAVLPYVDDFRARGVDGLVLGCTHFLYLAPQFTAAAGSELGIFHSLDGVARRTLFLLRERGEAADDRRSGGSQPLAAAAAGAYRLICTGPSDPSWKGLADLCGLEPERAA